MPAQIGGRSDAGAEAIHICNHTGKNDGKNGPPLGTRKKSSLQRKGSQAVSERIHGESVRRFGRFFRAGDEQAQCPRHDAEFHRQA